MAERTDPSINETRLYHFTCGHGAEGIEKMGVVFPNWHPLLQRRLSWFTDLNEPDAGVVGLTSSMLDCDRLSHRFEVDSLVPRRWLGSREQADTAPWVQADLHAGADPEHWWVSAVPVPVVV